MLDNFNREINYLRISLTDRCNLRCVYCMPESGIEMISHDEILSFEEIFNFTKIAVAKGITKVRLTGGEPLARKGTVKLVKMLSSIKEIKDLAMTTNGTMLSRYALELKNAGLHRVNISLDTVDPDEYVKITRCGNINDVFAGIDAAKKVSLLPVKINCVIKNSITEPNAIAVKKWCEENKLEVRFINEMDIEQGQFGIVHGGDGGNCANCNRLRLTSNGFLKPCLFNDVGINIRKMEYDKAIEEALRVKPECGLHGSKNKFYNIGG